MSSNVSNQTEASKQTFWKLLSKEKYTVKIPRIQRDYAQGREETEPKQIRQVFLKDVFDALTVGKVMDINFIYGNIDIDNSGDKIFIPIDGQQRLTTLFLIHWYFAVWSGHQDDVKDILCRFQYDTRFVAGSFCKRLVEDVKVDLKDLAKTDRTLTDVIKDYYWFFSSYERDATIKAMLVMLQSIHSAVCNISDKSLVDLFFDKLTDNDCPISFLFLDIADVGLTDEIYIKMNARGKALTRFENFKAQLSGYLCEKDEEFSKEFIGNINGKWSGFFWNEEYRADIVIPETKEIKKSNVFDNQMMNLFRFIMYNEYIARVDMAEDSSEIKYLARRVLGSLSKESDFEFVNHLFVDEFKNIAGYVSSAPNVDINTFRQLNVLLNVLSKKKEETGNICFLNYNIFEKKYYDEENFFKRLIRSSQEKTLAYEDQLVIYAEYLFLIHYANSDYSFDKVEELTNWCRFIYNISRNMRYNTIDDYLRSVQRIRKIIDDEQAINILNYVATITHKVYGANSGYGINELAMKEECIKAHLILKGDTWKQSIINAENSFLDTQISALLSFSGIWQIYESEMSDFEKNNEGTEKLNSVNDIMNDVASERSYQEAFDKYLTKFNIIFDKNDLKPEMEDKSILRRALLTFGGSDSYMLPAGKPVKCFLDVTDRDDSFKRLFRDDNKKNKSDNTGVRIYFKQLLDSIDETKPITPQLQNIIDNMKFDEENKWKRYFIEMPELLESLYKRNSSVTEDKAIFKNSKRYICMHNADQILLLEKTKTSSNNREYYSYVLYLKAKNAGVNINYHKDFSEDTAKFAVYVDKQNRTIQVRYAKEDGDQKYQFIAKHDCEIIYKTEVLDNMLDFVLGNNPPDNDLKILADESDNNTLVNLDDSYNEKNAVDQRTTQEIGDTIAQEESDINKENDYKQLLIADVFSENKYNLFVQYCTANNWNTIGDLDGFAFYSLLDVQGIGRGKVDEIISMYNSVLGGDFAQTTTGVAEKMLFHDIQESIFNSKIEFLAGLGIRQKSIKRLELAGFSTIGDLKDIPESTLKFTMTAGDYSNLLAVEETLKEPLSIILRMALEDKASTQDYKIVILKENGNTLQAIGDLFNVTRERVRQVISRFEEDLCPIINEWQSTLLAEKNYISSDELMNYFDVDDYGKVLVHYFRDNENFEYLECADVFVLLNGEKKHCEDDILAIAAEFVGDGANVNDILEDFDFKMNGLGYSFMDEAALLNLVQQHGYCVYNDYISKGKQSYGLLCSKIVAKRFPNGIKLYDGSADLKRLREYALREYGDIGVSDDDRALSVRISDYLVLCDKGCVTAEENVHIDMELLNKIKKYIDDSADKQIYYVTLYSIFEKELLKSSNIDNYNFLHGVLKLYFGDEYDFSDRDYLTKNGDGLITGKLSDKITTFIGKLNRPASRQEIKNNIPGVSDVVLMNAVVNNPKLIPWEYNYFYSIDCVDMSEDDKLYLQRKIEEITSQNSGYCSDNMLYDEVCEDYENFIIRNNLKDASNLFYICMKLFESEFDFRRPNITKKDLFDNISIKNVALHLMNYPNEISFIQYQKMAENLKWSHVTYGMVFSEIEQDYIRVNEDRYVKKDMLVIEDITLKRIAEIVKAEFVDGFVSLITFNKWNEMPNIGYQWNSHLLRAIIDKYLDEFKIIESRAKDRRYERGMIVEADSIITNYTELVISVLKTRGISVIQENELLFLLLEKGMIYKAIPKEVYVSEKIKYEDCKISIT